MSIDEIIQLITVITFCIAGLMFLGTICYALIKYAQD